MAAVNARRSAGKARLGPAAARTSARPQREGAVHARPSPGQQPAVAWDGPAGMLDPRMLPYLQRSAGNASVAALVEAVLQREAAGAVLPRAPAAGATASPQAAPASREGASILLEKVPSGGKRPLDLAALVPPAAGAAGGAVSVLLHLHGISIYEKQGHGYEQMIHKGIIPPEFQMESQLEAVAAANPKQRLIAILPAGNTVPAGQTTAGKTTWTVDFGGFDTDTLADQAVNRLTSMGRLPAGSTAGGVIVSAHSGGGFEAKHAARGKKVVGMLAFESIHGDVDEYRKLLFGHLQTDLGELSEIAKRPGSTADVVFTAQKQYLLERGFRFVGFAGSNPGYRETFHQLDVAIHGRGGWVDGHAAALQQASGAHYGEIKAMLEANYQFHVEKTGDHFKVMQGNLAKAMGAPVPVAPSVPVVHAEKPGAAKDAARPAAAPAAKKPKPKRRHRTATGPIPLPEGAINSDQLPAFGGPATTKFRKDVYDKQQQISLAVDEERAMNGEPTRFSQGIPKAQLGSVDGKDIHKAAEADANALISDAHTALAAATAKGDPLALACTAIGVNNAYRSPKTDFDAWQNSFETHYNDTADARKAQVGGPFGPASVNLLAWELVNYKAIPGFSNHSQGMAMDLQTVQNGVKLGPSSKQKGRWRKSWLYQWLVKNGPLHNFTQLKTEEWHWDHHGGAAAGPAPAAPKSSATTAAPATTPAVAPPAVKPAAAAPVAKPAAAAPVTAVSASSQTPVSISFGPNARKDAVAASSVEVLADILRAAGLSKATITSTARSADDQARAMYQNLVTAGVKAQRKLYRAPGNQVIDTFVALHDAGKAAQEIQDGMRDRILEIGPSKVSRHCGDFHVLNVFDVGPYSLGGPKARKAFAEAAEAEVGKRISKFIPWPQDPGDHIEIKMSSGPPAVTPAGSPATPVKKEDVKAAPAKKEEVKAVPAAPAAASPSSSLADWLHLLPYAKRDKKHRITAKDYGVDVPAVDVGTMNAQQRQLFDQIRANRESLPSLIRDKEVQAGGISYHDSVRASEVATPKELETANTPALKAKKLAWEEVRTEGGLDSINTYDSEIVTWGKGFSAKSHSMNDVLLTMFESDPEARTMLFAAGIALTAKDWMVVNSDSGAIETGTDALRLLQFDRKLLSVFIRLGSEPKHARHALEAQWAWISKRTANVPEYAYNWPPATIKLLAHLGQWMPAFGWNNVDYKGTGGDIYQVIKLYLRHFIAKVSGALAPRPGSGADLIAAGWDMVKPGHRFYAFAGGAGIEAIKASAAVVTAAQVDTDGGLAGHILIPIRPANAEKKTKHGAYVPRSSQYFDLG